MLINIEYDIQLNKDHSVYGLSQWDAVSMKHYH